MMGGAAGMPCCKMPIPLHICPTCAQGVKQTRGWQWIDPVPWLAGPCTTDMDYRPVCPANKTSALGERVGLLWIGTQFYPTPEVFIGESNRLGISRRITAVPRGFKLGETWVFLAHPKAITTSIPPTPGIFRIFKPTAIEKIVTESEADDAAAMEDLRGRGITPVVVPDNDRDHQGTVYDDDDQPGLTLASAPA